MVCKRKFDEFIMIKTDRSTHLTSRRQHCGTFVPLVDPNRSMPGSGYQEMHVSPKFAVFEVLLDEVLIGLRLKEKFGQDQDVEFTPASFVEEYPYPFILFQTHRRLRPNIVETRHATGRYRRV